MPAAANVEHAYDARSMAIRALGPWGWGALLNLGYYAPLSLPLLPLGLDRFQRALLRRALDLLDPGPGERVLDVACGRGASTQAIAARGAEAFGLDVVDAHVADARARYGRDARVRFFQGDATRLGEALAAAGLRDQTFDRMLCLEAAFQFGPEGRASFLRESFRALRPGGRLVLVDFAWTTDDPGEIEALDPERLVRGTWCYEEFEPLARYRARARDVGFRELRLLDWSARVIGSFQHICELLCVLARFRASWWLLVRLRPALASWDPAELPALRRLVRAHDRVRRRTRYAVLVLEKPASGAGT